MSTVIPSWGPRRASLPPIRLSKILAQAGLSSRRGAEALLAAGRVTVNGVVRREPGAQADPAVDRIACDGQPVLAREAATYLLLHKPRGYVTSLRDPEGRRVVVDLLPPGTPRVFPVGRLDYDVEGLLLLTDDGDLAHRLLHPRYEIPRVYEAEVEGRPRSSRGASASRTLRTAPPRHARPGQDATAHRRRDRRAGELARS